MVAWLAPQPGAVASGIARRVRRVQAIHAKIANRRRDALHNKSALDAGWSAYRTLLKYKSAAHHGDTNSASVITPRGLVWLELEFATVGEARACETVVSKDSGALGSMAAPGIKRPVVGVLQQLAQPRNPALTC